MRPLRNLTLHVQGPVERTLAAEAGFDLAASPEGGVVARGGLEPAVSILTATLRDCARSGFAVLAGGYTGVWIAAVLRLNGEIPEIYCFDTERRQDEHGRFVFTPRSLVRVADYRFRP